MKHVNLTTYVLLTIALALIGFGCDNTEDPIIITGQVIDLDSGNTVSQADVEITSPEELSASTFSDESGQYMFDEVQIDSVLDITVQASREGFSTESVTVTAVPERQLNVPDLKIRNQQTDTPIGERSKGAASIELITSEDVTINVTETGGNVNSAFTFEVQDSSGQAISQNNAVDVEFRLVGGPDDVTITPDRVRTNANGRVTSNVFAGKTAGNLKVEARIVREDVGLTIVSSPILLTIHGGFPDLEHFSIAASVFNFEGWSINGNRNEITVNVGDKFSNPVKPDTPVYFNSTGGIIQGSGTTDEDGEVVVELISADPRPLDGLATIRAHTFDENDQPLEKEIRVLFSGPPTSETIQVSPSSFNIGPNGSQIFNMTITDINDNPLPAGTSIEVIPPDGMAVDGDVDVEVPNNLNPGPNRTQFTFTARDSDDESNDSQDVTIRIEVETPGGFKATKTIQGRKAKAF